MTGPRDARPNPAITRSPLGRRGDRLVRPRGSGRSIRMKEPVPAARNAAGVAGDGRQSPVAVPWTTRPRVSYPSPPRAWDVVANLRPPVATIVLRRTTWTSAGAADRVAYRDRQICRRGHADHHRRAHDFRVGPRILSCCVRMADSVGATVARRCRHKSRPTTDRGVAPVDRWSIWTAARHMAGFRERPSLEDSTSLTGHTVKEQKPRQPSAKLRRRLQERTMNHVAGHAGQAPQPISRFWAPEPLRATVVSAQSAERVLHVLFSRSCHRDLRRGFNARGGNSFYTDCPDSSITCPRSPQLFFIGALFTATWRSSLHATQ